jgi:hypothetical protein
MFKIFYLSYDAVITYCRLYSYGVICRVTDGSDKVIGTEGTGIVTGGTGSVISGIRSDWWD